MRTLSAELKDHLALTTTSIALGWIIVRTDGTTYRFCSCTRPMKIDIGDGAGIQDYVAAEGFNRSAFQADANGNVSNANILGVLDSLDLNDKELRRGLFDFADVRIFTFNFRATSQGILRMMKGQFGEVITTPQGYFTVELRDLTQVLTRELGEAYSKDCRDDLGGPRCRFDLEAAQIAFTVTAVDEARRTFQIEDLTGEDANWAQYGKVIWDSGDNAGIAIEVRSQSNGIAQVIELFDDVPFNIQVGDTGLIGPGCDKRFETCKDKFANWLNFVGEKDVPGQDIMGQYPDAQ